MIVVITLSLAAITVSCARTPGRSLDARVRDFVSQSYVHGVPYDDARALGTEAGPILMRLLDESGMGAYRGNIVVTLCIVGSDQSAQRVITLIQAGDGPISPDEVRTRLAAVMALGYTVFGSNSQVALRYLREGLVLDAWRERVHWRLPSGAEPLQMLWTQAVAGLGLSGSPEGLEALSTASVRALASQLEGQNGQALVDEAVRANKFIAANGMSRYYERFLRK